MAFNSPHRITSGRAYTYRYDHLHKWTLLDSSRLTLAIPRPEIKIAHDQIKMAESSLKLNDSKYKPQLYVGVDGVILLRL